MSIRGNLAALSRLVCSALTHDARQHYLEIYQRTSNEKFRPPLNHVSTEELGRIVAESYWIRCGRWR